MTGLTWMVHDTWMVGRQLFATETKSVLFGLLQQLQNTNKSCTSLVIGVLFLACNSLKLLTVSGHLEVGGGTPGNGVLIVISVVQRTPTTDEETTAESIPIVS
jgi:hypothetical protein